MSHFPVTKTKFDCPICEQPLYSQPAISGPYGHVDIWCGNAKCKSLAANAGWTAPTVEEAFKALEDKLKHDEAA